jgi:hypothetical protein
VLEPNDTVTPPTSPQVVQVLVENHRRFLGFLERRVGSREVAGRHHGQQCVRAAVPRPRGVARAAPPLVRHVRDARLPRLLVWWA